MKQLLLMLSLTVSVLIAHSQNVVYDENAEVRSVPAFNSVEVSGTISLYLTQGPVQGIAISAGEAKYNNKIKTEVKNGVLHISVDGGMWNGFNWGNKKLKAYVTATELKRIEASGATYINIPSLLKSEDLKIEVSGASELKGEIEVSKLNLDVSGASSIKLSGKVTEAVVDLSGAGIINAYPLITDSCKASTSGASTLKITVKNKLTAEASGGSNIYYKGTPNTTNINSSAGSTIKNKSEIQ